MEFELHQREVAWSMAVWSKEAFSPTQLSKAEKPHWQSFHGWCVVVVPADTAALGCSWTSWARAAHSASCHMKMTSWCDVKLKPPNCALCWDQRGWVGLGFMRRRLGWSGLWIKAGFDSSAVKQPDFVVLPQSPHVVPADMSSCGCHLNLNCKILRTEPPFF